MSAHALVLAAGGGHRFGGRKMLARWCGEPLVRAAVRIALASPVRDVTVVTGADSDEVMAALAPLASPRLNIIVNPNWRSGIASSLKAGLGAVPNDAGCAIVFLGDMPRVPPEVSVKLLNAIQSGAPAALVEVDGTPGHPVAFRRALFERLRKLDGDRGARATLLEIEGIARISSNDRGCLFDIDEPAAMF